LSDLNRLLARTEEKILGFDEDLRERGIRLEMEI
jgi:hypothetical protein